MAKRDVELLAAMKANTMIRQMTLGLNVAGGLPGRASQMWRHVVEAGASRHQGHLWLVTSGTAETRRVIYDRFTSFCGFRYAPIKPSQCLFLVVESCNGDGL